MVKHQDSDQEPWVDSGDKTDNNWDNALPGPPMASHTLAKTSESVSPKKGG